jgi:predicted transcriptional regulator
MAETDNQTTTLVELTTDIASAYVAANTVAAADLPGLIKMIYGALSGASAPAEAAAVQAPPAVSIKKSVTTDQLICLEDGRRFRSIKRHLQTAHGLSPKAYRAKWGLPKTYPMVAPAYAAARSSLAKQMGLGQGGRPVTKAKPAATKAAAPKARRAKS